MSKYPIFNFTNLTYVYPFKDAPEMQKLAVWAKGEKIPGYDANVMRRDPCGKIMLFSQHGNTESEFGWEIDHIYPRAKGGQTVIANLQPLNWLTNRKKADTYPYFCE